MGVCDFRNRGSRLRFLALVSLAVPTFLPAPGLQAQDALSPEHERIAFLIGEWRTESEFPDGRVWEGNLRYRWVLGGAWMQVEFLGEPPDGTVWEAHVMQRWNPRNGAYESWAFFGAEPPVIYRGSVPEPGFFRIESTADGVTTGIDYHAREDGSVYQENWVVEGGERTVTLRTRYRSAGR